MNKTSENTTALLSLLSSEEGLERTYAVKNLLKDPSLANKVADIIYGNGFDPKVLAWGNGSIVLEDRTSKDIVLRLSPAYENRPIIPFIVQPVFSKKIDCLRLEILPNLTPDAVEMRELTPVALAKYRASANRSGYRDFDTENLVWDIGVFHYEDPKKPGSIRTAIMGTDGGLIQDADGKPPTCTADYPTLESQHKEQCKLVAADPRLQALLKGKPPKKLPVTKIVPAISEGIEL